MPLLENSDAEHIRKASKEGRLVLFCGSGISFYAGIKSHGELSDVVGDEFFDTKGLSSQALGNERNTLERFKEQKNLPCIFRWYKNSYYRHLGQDGKEAICNIISREFAKEYSNLLSRKSDLGIHRKILSIGQEYCGPIIATTNWDVLFSKEFTSVSTTPVYAKSEIKIESLQPLNVLHIHGVINLDGAFSELIVDEDDFDEAYSNESIKMFFKQLLNDSEADYTLLFLGYSLEDYHVKKLFESLIYSSLGDSSGLQKSHDYQNIIYPKYHYIVLPDNNEGRAKQGDLENLNLPIKAILYPLEENHMLFSNPKKAEDIQKGFEEFIKELVLLTNQAPTSLLRDDQIMGDALL